MEDHDQRFKIILKEFFQEFMQLFFPAWVDRFDFSGLEWQEQEAFPDPPQGERKMLDLVAHLPVRQAPSSRAPGQEGRWLVMLHVEVERKDSVEPLRGRMFGYFHYLRHKHQIPVLPIGLYLQVGLNGIGWDVYEEWFWEQRLVHFEYAYIGLPALDAFEYLRDKNWLGVALSVLMRIPEERKAELKAEAMQRLATSPENEWRRYLLCECVEAYLPLEGPQLAEFEGLLQTEPYKEAMKMAVTSFEKGMEKGVEKGRQMAETSFEKGMEKGMEKGQRALLRRWLERRFSPLSEEVLQRLDSWPSERLPELGDAVLTASSLQELGLED